MTKQQLTTNEKLEASGLLTHPEAYSVPEGIQRMIFTATGKPLSKSSIYALINNHQLPAKKLGTKTIVLRSEFLKFLQNLPDFHDVNAPGSLSKKAHPEVV